MYYNVYVLYFCLLVADIEGKLHEVMKDDVIEFSDDGQSTSVCIHVHVIVTVIQEFSVSLN